jgi:hypothetical protein
MNNWACELSHVALGEEQGKTSARGQPRIEEDSHADCGTSRQLAFDSPAEVLAGGVLPRDGERPIVVAGDGSGVDDG